MNFPLICAVLTLIVGSFMFITWRIAYILVHAPPM